MPPTSPPLPPLDTWVWILPHVLCEAEHASGGLHPHSPPYATQPDATTACRNLGCAGLVNSTVLPHAHFPGLTGNEPYLDMCTIDDPDDPDDHGEIHSSWVADSTTSIYHWIDPNRTTGANCIVYASGDVAVGQSTRNGFGRTFIHSAYAACTGCPADLHECTSPAGPPPLVPPPSSPAPCGEDSPVDPTGVYKDGSTTHGTLVTGQSGESCATRTGARSPHGQGHQQIFCERDETTGVELAFPRCVPIGDSDGPNSDLVPADGAAACSTAALTHYGCMNGCRMGYSCCSSTDGSCIPVGETCPCPVCATSSDAGECPGGDDHLFLVTSASGSTQCCRRPDAPSAPPTPPPLPPPFPPPPPRDPPSPTTPPPTPPPPTPPPSVPPPETPPTAPLPKTPPAVPPTPTTPPTPAAPPSGPPPGPPPFPPTPPHRPPSSPPRPPGVPPLTSPSTPPPGAPPLPPPDSPPGAPPYPPGMAPVPPPPSPPSPEEPEEPPPPGPATPERPQTPKPPPPPPPAPPPEGTYAFLVIAIFFVGVVGACVLCCAVFAYRRRNADHGVKAIPYQGPVVQGKLVVGYSLKSQRDAAVAAGKSTAASTVVLPPLGTRARATRKMVLERQSLLHS